jgi:hypothetical protein
LGDVCVGSLQAGSDALGRLVGELERHLEGNLREKKMLKH